MSARYGFIQLADKAVRAPIPCRFMVQMRDSEIVGAFHERAKGRQVLDCGDGVRGVTALALAAIMALELGAGPANPPHSGDSADSVAAVQDARARLEIYGPNARPE